MVGRARNQGCVRDIGSPRDCMLLEQVPKSKPSEMKEATAIERYFDIPDGVPLVSVKISTSARK